ncbi:hypothetical protein EMCRGX_G014461 [Ephydatia muelleri]
MDGASIEDLRPHLTCGICKSLLHEPKLLPCLHNFCGRCLEKSAGAQNTSTVHCPLCRDKQRPRSLAYDTLKTNSSFENIIGQLKLRDAFKRRSVEAVTACELQCVTCLKDPAVALCEDCSASLCSDCERHHRKAVKTAHHSLLVLAGAESTQIPVTCTAKDTKDRADSSCFRKTVARDSWHCAKHFKKMKVYCLSCDQVLCRTCAHEDHASHCCQDVIAAAPAFQRLLQRSSSNTRAVLLKFNGALDEIHHVRGHLENNRQVILTEIEEGYRQLVDALTKEKERQVKQLESIFEAKIATLHTQQEEFEGIKESLETGLELADRISSPLFISAEFLFLWSRVNTRLKGLEQQYAHYGHGCRESSTIGYGAKTVVNPRGAFGEVFIEPCHRGFSAPDVAAAHVVKGQDFEFVVSCGDVTGASLLHGGRIPTMEVKLIPEGAPSREVTGSVTEVTEVDGNYDVIGTVQVCVAPPVVQTLEVVVMGYDDSMHPWGIASGKACIAVSDIDGRVIFYDKYFQILNELEQFENENLLFNSPQGLAFDFEDNLVVVENKGHQVRIVTVVDGRPLRTIGSHGNGPGQFESPSSVAVDKVGRIFVGDSKRVQYFNPDSTYLGVVQGLADPLPDDCYSVAIDAYDRLFVASCRGNKVYALKRKPSAESTADPLGYALEFTFGCEGEVEEHNLRSPIAIAVDRHYGYVYVTEDLVESRLVVFTLYGRYVASFKNTVAKSFVRPTGLCVLANSRIVVVNGDRQLIVLKVLGV